MGFGSASRVDALLHELCVAHGYCLPPEEQARILAAPPDQPEAFADAVLRAEGLDPGLCDGQQRRRLIEVVERWLRARSMGHIVDR
jgi:hypothetical protein